MFFYSIYFKNFANIFLVIILIISVFFFSKNTNSQEFKNIIEYRSLKFKESNLRIGPGKKFPINWTLIRKDLPIKITESFENWKKIELHDKTVGWIHNSQLSKNRTIIFISDANLYSKANKNSFIIANIEIFSILDLKNCKENWCKVRSNKHKISGYVLKDKIWGKN